MGYLSEPASTEIIDLASALERALDTASSALNRASIELGAADVAVLLAGRPDVEITYFWSSFGSAAPVQEISAVQQVNQHHLKQVSNADELEARIQSYELAYRMQTSGPEAVDLSKESEATKKLYSIDEEITRKMGTNCLMARRLVERGVRFVQVYCGSGSGWDAHEDVMVNHTKMCKISDKPVAALLADLKAKGLLDSTVGGLGNRVWAHTVQPERQRPRSMR
jgi:hypothetical protein